MNDACRVCGLAPGYSHRECRAPLLIVEALDRLTAQLGIIHHELADLGNGLDSLTDSVNVIAYGPGDCTTGPAPSGEPVVATASDPRPLAVYPCRCCETEVRGADHCARCRHGRCPVCV